MDKGSKQVHKSVLLHEVVEGLDVKSGEVFLDGTFGAAGHSLEILKRAKGKVTLVAIDADKEALKKASAKIKETGATFFAYNGNFRNLDKALDENGIEKIDKALFDFGLSSDQLDTSGRGFSFRFDEPLLMTLKTDPTDADLTAEYVVNNFEQRSLEDIIRGFGEEKFAGRIARVIVESREVKPIKTTFELSEIIRSAIPVKFRNGKIHPATKTFQAIRIVVNGELDAIDEGLRKAFERLSVGGRIAAISFHSLEDRIVKRFFKELEKENKVKLISKKPITPTREEILENGRSRSAKLRIIEKL